MITRKHEPGLAKREKLRHARRILAIPGASLIDSGKRESAGASAHWQAAAGSRRQMGFKRWRRVAGSAAHRSACSLSVGLRGGVFAAARACLCAHVSHIASHVPCCGEHAIDLEGWILGFSWFCQQYYLGRRLLAQFLRRQMALSSWAHVQRVPLTFSTKRSW